MADNVELSAGSGGAVIATDDDGVAQHQYVKIEFGADNTQTKVTSSVGLPVGDAGGSLTVDNAGTFAVQATLQAGTNAFGKLAANSGVDIGDVDVTTVVPGTGATNLGKSVDAVAGATDTGVLGLAVRRAADTPISGLDGDYEPLKTDANGHLKVEIFDGGDSHTIDGTVTANLGATDNAVLDAIQAAVELIDNAVSGAGFNVTQLNGAAVPIGAGTEAAAVRVTVATDSTGVLSVDDNAGSLTVDNAALSVTGGGVEAGALRVTLASDSTGVVSVDDNGGALTVDNAGTFATQATLQAGSALAGDVGISGARTSGGTTLYKNIDVDETEDQIKATAGQVYWIHAVNLTAAVIYLKFYNATAANVVVGTTAPDLTFPIPTQGDTNGAGFVLAIPNGIAFSTAITIACTTGLADADSGAPAANACVVNLGYA